MSKDEELDSAEEIVSDETEESVETSESESEEKPKKKKEKKKMAKDKKKKSKAKKEEKPEKKNKSAKKVEKKAKKAEKKKKSSGEPSRRNSEMKTPFREDSIIGRGWAMAIAGTSMKELTKFSKKEGFNLMWMLRTLRKGERFGWSWKVKEDNGKLKIYNAKK